MDQVKSTRVQIFGNEYYIRADADPEYIKSIAAYVHSKMSEIAQSQSLVSSTKVAILAAIQIADEVFQERRKREKTEQDVTAKVEQLAEVLARAL